MPAHGAQAVEAPAGHEAADMSLGILELAGAVGDAQERVAGGNGGIESHVATLCVAPAQCPRSRIRRPDS